MLYAVKSIEPRTDQIFGIVTINKQLKIALHQFFFILSNFLGASGDDNLAIIFNWD